MRCENEHNNVLTNNGIEEVSPESRGDSARGDRSRREGQRGAIKEATAERKACREKRWFIRQQTERLRAEKGQAVTHTRTNARRRWPPLPPPTECRPPAPLAARRPP
jgi:hypothetical protein